MTLLVLTSASGAPGATILALALAFVWPTAFPGRRALIVDADPSGSGIVPGYLGGSVGAQTGILALASQRGPLSYVAIVEQAVALDERPTLLLPGIADSAQAAALRPVWGAFVSCIGEFDAAGYDVVVDAGRLGHRHEPTPLLEAADDVALVMASGLADVTHARPALRDLATMKPAPGRCCLAVVGEKRPYSASEIATALGAPRVGSIAHDPHAAQCLAGVRARGHRLDRSALMRSVTAWVHGLHLAGADREPVADAVPVVDPRRVAPPVQWEGARP